MRLRLTPRAVADLDAISAYVRAENPTAAERLEQELRAAFAILVAHPDMGRLLRNTVRRFNLPRRPYLIFYRVLRRAKQVDVITIRHASRAPAPWMR